MKKQCINCRYAKKPRSNCACNNKVKYPLTGLVEMKYHIDGSSYCDSFREIYIG